MRTIGILVGGGPAPGINGVIAAVTIEAVKRGWRVRGFEEGFRHLVRGDASKARDLTVEDVSRIHLTGGSLLATSRENPRSTPERFAATVAGLRGAGIDALVTIGGEGTAVTAGKLAEHLPLVHVPKTIDNDLPLPAHIPTFGFQTARHVGTDIVHALMEDAKSTRRWYVVVTMGREAGHLALGIGKAAGATLTLIPEEFGGRVTFEHLCDVVEAAILKRRSMGREHGVAVLAEGITEILDRKDRVERDEYGNPKLAEANLGILVRDEVRRRLRERGVPATIVAKDIGYELRCAPPIPFDQEYTRDLGYAAVVLLEAGQRGIVTVDGGAIRPVPFTDLLDGAGKPRVRRVDLRSTAYAVAWEYMIRLTEGDLADPQRLAALAQAGNLTPEAFRERFSRAAARHPGAPPVQGGTREAPRSPPKAL